MFYEARKMGLLYTRASVVNTVVQFWNELSLLGSEQAYRLGNCHQRLSSDIIVQEKSQS